MTQTTPNSELNSEIAAVDFYKVADSSPPPDPVAQRHFDRLIWFSTLVLPLGFLLLLLCFGGVHPVVYLPAQALIFLLLAAATACAGSVWRDAFPRGQLSFLVLVGLLGYAAYSLLQYGALSLFGVEHPVLGTVSPVPSLADFRPRFRAILFFISVFVLLRLLLSSSRYFYRRLLGLLLAAGCAAALISLAHWFHDNGLLFWTFAPDYVFSSTRARWPFVNPNHLGHFLLPLFFLLLARLLSQLASIKEKTPPRRVPKIVSLAQLLSRASVQNTLISAAFTLVLLVAVLLSIAGTLSRSTWLGASMGLVLFLILDYRIRRRLGLGPKKQPVLPPVKKEAGSHRHSGFFERRRRPLSESRMALPMSRATRPLLALLAAALFGFFLYGQGAELVEGRIEYGLKYSKDDMRWTFYSDTWEMFKTRPLFGVGLGAWQAHYPRYMNPLLANVRPGYLHSDPLELLVESGVVGALPILLLFVVLLWRVPQALLRRTYEHSLNVAALYSGLLALALASLSDFPFRIPVIQAASAALLALTVFYTDSDRFRHEAVRD